MNVENHYPRMKWKTSLERQEHNSEFSLSKSSKIRNRADFTFKEAPWLLWYVGKFCGVLSFLLLLLSPSIKYIWEMLNVIWEQNYQEISFTLWLFYCCLVEQVLVKYEGMVKAYCLVSGFLVYGFRRLYCFILSSTVVASLIMNKSSWEENSVQTPQFMMDWCHHKCWGCFML